MERISVAVRVRPIIKQDNDINNPWKVDENSISLCNSYGIPVPSSSYTFDHVFGTKARNAEVYNIHTKEVIASAVQGFNGTVFAYGQTSSGKTYTMQGSGDVPGIIHLGVRDVFDSIKNISGREFLTRVSYMEIYNEDINDLLAPENRKLRIHENLERGIFVAGLREEIVNSPDQVFEFLRFGEAHRHYGETNMNVYSSRSHTIFRMVIESRDKSKDSAAVRVSTLNMVDLAGSERVAKTGAGGVRLKEGTHINKSLMILGTVINKLSEAPGKQGAAHIPYRDSKLTRILQSALDGNAKTAIICTITPDEIHVDESRGTLQFASRATKVSICAHVNEILTDAALLKRQKKEIEDLRQKLQGSRSDDLEKQILNLRNDLLKYELEKERLCLELEEEKKAQLERERRIKEQEAKIENLSSMVINSAWDDRDTKMLRKVNRRETWCPRQLSSELAVESSEKNHSKEPADSFDYSRVSFRRDNSQTPLPAFEELFDNEGQTPWSSASISPFTDNVSFPSAFDQTADEETWLSLNKDSTLKMDFLDQDFTDNVCLWNGNGTTRMSTVEFELRELKVQNEELEERLRIKEEEASKHAQEVNKLRKEREAMQIFIFQALYKDQQRMQECLKEALAELEMEVNNLRILKLSLEETLADCHGIHKTTCTCLHETNDSIKTLIHEVTHWFESNVSNIIKQEESERITDHDMIDISHGAENSGEKQTHAFLAMPSVPEIASCNGRSIADTSGSKIAESIDMQIMERASTCELEGNGCQSYITDIIKKLGNGDGEAKTIENAHSFGEYNGGDKFTERMAEDLSSESPSFEGGELSSASSLSISKPKIGVPNIEAMSLLASELMCKLQYTLQASDGSLGLIEVLKELLIIIENIPEYRMGNTTPNNEISFEEASNDIETRRWLSPEGFNLSTMPEHETTPLKQLNEESSLPDTALVNFVPGITPEKETSENQRFQNDHYFSQLSKACLMERLCMSEEHISMLDQQLAAVNFEKELVRKALAAEMSMNEEKIEMMQLQNSTLTDELSKCMGTLAAQHEYVASICNGIRDFENELNANTVLTR